MIVLGLDPAQKTGWAQHDTRANLSAMRCGTLRFTAVKKEFEQNAGMLGAALKDLIKEIGKPDFAVIEKAPRQSAGMFRKGGKPSTIKFMGQEFAAQEGDEDGGGGLQSTLSTNQMAAALASVLGCFNIPFVAMTAAEWRRASYGFGTRKGWERQDWKKHARQMCNQMRITATNDDMAEACWIAYAAKGSDKFRWLQAQMQGKSAA